jgi:hypothetical protein
MFESSLLVPAAIILVVGSMPLIIFMFFVQPIWCIIDCAVNENGTKTAKVVWIIFLVLLWGITNWFYGALAAKGTVLRRLSRFAWLLLIVLLIAFMLLPKPLRTQLINAIDDEDGAASTKLAISGTIKTKDEVAFAPPTLDQRPVGSTASVPLPDLRIERIVPSSAGSGAIGRWFNVTVVNKGLAATSAPVDFRARTFVETAAGASGTPLLVLTCAIADVGAPSSSEPTCPRASVGALDPGARKTISMFVQGVAPRSDEAKFRVELAVNPCKGAFVFDIDDLPNCQVVEGDTKNNIATFDSTLFQTARRDNIK